MAPRITIFLSAFLLFAVQSICAKLLLPWFGGTSAVWATCLLFFQTALLLGYLYAHASDRYLSLRNQARVHLLVLSAGALLLGWQVWQWAAPLFPPRSSQVVAPQFPQLQILQLLTISIGLPFVCLSATSPLLQHWFAARSSEPSAWRLYALSNAGSLLGLVSYPFLIEPWLSLSLQVKAWGVLFLACACACGWSALNLTRPRCTREDRREGEESLGLESGLERVSVLLWLLLSGVTSALLVAVTNALCQEIAVVPLLWVVPLALYLLTLILCFDHPRWYRRRWFVPLTAFATLLALLAAQAGTELDIPRQIIAGSLFLFLFCMTAHGELVRIKPGPRHLTLFYLVIAAGGVLGTASVALLAPVVLKRFWELHLAVLAGWLLLAWILARDRTSFFYQGDAWHFWAGVLFLSFLIQAAIAGQTGWTRIPSVAPYARWLLFLGAIASTALVWSLVRRRSFVQSRFWPRVLVGGVIFLTECFLAVRMRGDAPGALETIRNFYGILRVVPMAVGESPTPCLALMHGQINHGYQNLGKSQRPQPAGYSGRSSGAGIALEHHSRRSGTNTIGQPLRIGVTGLGVGAIAAYARPGDLVRFYEINPAVVRLAAGPDPWFTFVKQCQGQVQIATGDARRVLEQELATTGSQLFDVLILDAFSSDSIPAHLLTVEAFELYLSHLRDEQSLIVVNISNRFLDLRPLLFGVAEHFRLEAVCIDSRGDLPWRCPSRYVLLTRSREFVRNEAVRRSRLEYKATRRLLWSDQFSNILQLLR